jgi:hypothetical protein
VHGDYNHIRCGGFLRRLFTQPFRSQQITPPQFCTEAGFQQSALLHDGQGKFCAQAGFRIFIEKHDIHLGLGAKVVITFMQSAEIHGPIIAARRKIKIGSTPDPISGKT